MEQKTRKSPYGPLGVIALQGCTDMGKQVINTAILSSTLITRFVILVLAVIVLTSFVSLSFIFTLG